MRIRGFSKFIDRYWTKEILNNTTLVVDGQNYFHNLYESSGLSYKFGCECDKYYQYLKDNLSKFKIANVKCLFIFKAGDTPKTRGEDTEFIPPIFMWENHRQILKDMGFEYTFCQYEAKTECIALAQKLHCPVLSYDIEFCFFGQYIPYTTLELNQEILTGCVFKVDRFISMVNINEIELATFVVLTDENIFPENYFLDVLTNLGLKYNKYNFIKKYHVLFRWLSMRKPYNADNIILENISKDDQAKFKEERDKLAQKMIRKSRTGISSDYLLNGCLIEVYKNDPLWFEKGFAYGTTRPYLNIYETSVVNGSHSIANDDPAVDDPLLLSKEIIKYAFNLLTNFTKTEFEIQSSGETTAQRIVKVQTTEGVGKPDYKANKSVFENGWKHIKALGLFDHFLTKTFQGFDLEILNQLPDDARLLVLALLYLKLYSKSVVKDAIVGSVMLSYVVIGVVNGHLNICSVNDKINTRKLMAQYTTGKFDIEKLELIHPLVEFQHCLDEIGFLNKLCGSPYLPTVFHKTYNGAFVYRVLYDFSHNCSGGSVWDFLSSKLAPAPDVLAFLNCFVDVYKCAFF